MTNAPITIALSPSGIACPEKVISAPLVRSNARCMYVHSDPAIAEFMSYAALRLTGRTSADSSSPTTAMMPQAKINIVCAVARTTTSASTGRCAGESAWP